MQSAPPAPVHVPVRHCRNRRDTPRARLLGTHFRAGTSYTAQEHNNFISFANLVNPDPDHCDDRITHSGRSRALPGSR